MHKIEWKGSGNAGKSTEIDLSRICMLLIFGAPVMEPPGKAALKQPITFVPSFCFPLTVLTKLWTVAYDSHSISPGTCTVPTFKSRDFQEEILEVLERRLEQAKHQISSTLLLA